MKYCSDSEIYFTTHFIIQGELVYRREDVYQCYSARKWLYRRRKVIEAEAMNPILKVPLKARKQNGSFKALTSYGVGDGNDGSEKATAREIQKGMTGIENDENEKLFAIWQTKDWSPPPISPNDPIPVNEHKNIELELINPGLRHIDESNMAKIAKHLCIPYAPCLIGFENSRQGRVPVIRGIVVHEHNYDLMQCAKFEVNSSQLEEAHGKRIKAVYKRWKRLIVGLQIKKRLEEEYPDEMV